MTLYNWLLALLPILVLVITIIGFRLNAPLAGTIALIVAGIIGFYFFGGNSFLLLVASAKGLSLSLFVLLILWSALLMYNLMQHLGCIDVIGGLVNRTSKSQLGQALLLGWAFSGFIEGIAGFGVAVAVLAPMMLRLGFSPVTAAATVLVGHSWAVTFGAMGSAYYTIQLATGIPSSDIGPVMAALFTLPILTTGLCVAHITGGWHSLREGASAILVVGTVMSVCVLLATLLDAAQIASIVAGLAGSLAIWILSKTSLLREAPDQDASSDVFVPPNRFSFHMAFLPYYILIFLTLLSQVPIVKQATDHLCWGVDFPGLRTSLGHVTPPVKDYAKICLLGHPASLILASTIISAVVFRWTGHWKRGAALAALKSTLRQCVVPSLGIVVMMMMASIMDDTGMTSVLASSIANATGLLFTIFSPYIGVLGCFMTGSNTNSNVMFGALQVETAKSLGVSSLVIASIQSIGGSLGSSIAPAKVLIGSGGVGLGGREGDIMRKTLGYCLTLVLLVGLMAYLITGIRLP